MRNILIKNINLKSDTPFPDTLLKIYSLIDSEKLMKIFVKWLENIFINKIEQLNTKYKFITF